MISGGLRTCECKEKDEDPALAWLPTADDVAAFRKT